MKLALVKELADELFPECPEVERVGHLEFLIELLTRTEDPSSGAPLLSARYHLFLRSLEGAFVTYKPKKRVLLSRATNNDEAAYFELALCRECGQHYLVGRDRDGKLQEAIRDPGHHDFGATFFRPLEDSQQDDMGRDDSSQRTLHRLCVICGALEGATVEPATMGCGHNCSILVEKQSRTEEKQDQIPRCSACGHQGRDPVREVVHGTDGPHAVVTTTLCQHLPASRRKVLAFADSRQEAAFFAWYLERSYSEILNRNLILRAARNAGDFVEPGLSMPELAMALRDLYLASSVFPSSIGALDLRRKSWLSVYREFLAEERRISLEGVGLVRWEIKWPEQMRVSDILLKTPWSLNREEARMLMVILIQSMRLNNAVELQAPSPIQILWGDLGLKSKQKRVKVGSPKGTRGVVSWDGERGTRFQFLRKLLLRKGETEEAASEVVGQTLRQLWQDLKTPDDEAPARDRLMLPVKDGRRLNGSWWRLFMVSDDDLIYQCETCSRIQPISVRGVCPSYRCGGTLQAIHAKNLRRNHYRMLYQDALPLGLRAEEHTAQIEKDKAREFQRDFKAGHIHVLSSSTTFELGVDLGDLDTILLRNVPPEAFNYAQRVGRAGRRAGYPGFAVTFCRRSPHDLYHFAEPASRILRGRVRPPKLSLSNEKIISRHMAATTLSYFFRHYPSRFDKVRAFLGDLQDPDATQSLASFVREKRGKLEQSLGAIVPGSMLERVGLHDESWIEALAGKDSRLRLAEEEASGDFLAVKRLENESKNKAKYETAAWAWRRANTISLEDTLSFLSRKGVIPKYGFPVDVVELDTHRTRETGEASEILLQRDLSIAIAEFAPTSKLVANKKQWESYGLKKVPERELERKHYLRCSRHNRFETWIPGQDHAKPCCNACVEWKYVIPRFGFVTNRDGPVKPSERSPRAFTTRPFFVDLTGDPPGVLDFAVIRLVKASPGRLLVLCEGRRGGGFYVCQECGAGFVGRKKSHKTPFGQPCPGTLENVSLGHVFVTDVVQLDFLCSPPKGVEDEIVWFAYSLAYAFLHGSADVLEVPATDLSVTVAYQKRGPIPPIILYDNVPGGAGLVAQLENEATLKACIEAAFDRVSGQCECGEDASCYGCLRNYRNQFSHQNLRRGPVKEYLKYVRKGWQK